MNKIRTIIRHNMVVRIIIGIVIGGIAGYLYYRFIGCRSGSCPITSNPLSSIIFGAIFGGLIASSK
jgi:hypothetical protein